MFKIAAIILAAGRGSRAAPLNKLLAEMDGRTVLDGAIAAALSSRADRVLAVVGHDAAAVRAHLAAKPISQVHNPAYDAGISGSLRVGVSALADDVDAAVILLGDMPYVTASHIDRLIAAFDPGVGIDVCVPVCRGRRGNPVLWGRACFDALSRLTGDRGGRALFDVFADRIRDVAVDDDGVLIDIDRGDDLRRAGGGDRRRPA